MKPTYEFSDSELRDPEDRAIDEQDVAQVREKMLDKTIADSFPASDPPSTNPAPAVIPSCANDDQSKRVAAGIFLAMSFPECLGRW